MPPGWYPDPFGAALRWWDGATWTVHTVRFPSALVAVADPGADLEAEQRAGRRASIALIFGALLSAASLIVSALVFGPAVHRLIHDLRVGDTARLPQINLSVFLPLQLFSFVGLAVQILVMIWLYRAATLAGRAGLPARHDPIWGAVGFIVPIINFWFPYQVAADTLPSGDPARSVVGWWWTWWLAQNFVGIPVLIVSLFVSASTMTAVAVVAAVFPLLAAYTGRKMIAVVGQAHERLIANVAR